ncbi:MAG: Meiotic Sister-Chromatid recombination aldehyde dehydrogenase [Cirrosporium novae-zelandiae]|nr:MAG: Meiotic Sister-Chromatid recombination aldehyde dehydrogenase [Cirrosporium novae-zelandiae]
MTMDLNNVLDVLSAEINAQFAVAGTLVLLLSSVWLWYICSYKDERAVGYNVHGSSSIQCYCPANGAFLGRVNPATFDGIDRAIVKAQEAQVAWSKTSFSERRRVLKTLLQYVLENQETIAIAACLDSGKTKIDASLGEILVTVEKLKWMINHGEKALLPEKRPTSFLMMYKVNEVLWEPLGVVAALVSWNYPFHNLIGPIISSIFAGNGIVVKVSENTAWSSQFFASIVRGALTACGHSEKLVQVLTCWPSVASHLTSHPGISHITFIGSQPVAHSVCTSAAKSLTPVCAELGGKDPSIVLDDVKDIKRISSILMRGVFQSAGQNCIGIERVIALPGVYQKIIDLVQTRIQNLRSGSIIDVGEGEDIDMGAMISASNFDNLETLIAEAVSQGARLLAGGKRYNHPKHPKGHYFQPTLLVNVTSSMRIAQNEVFGPVFLLMPAKSVNNAISIANSTPFALGASVFGSSTSHLNKVVRELRAGMIAVNDFAVYYAVQLPFGGASGSGYGRFAGEEGLRSVCNTKAVCRDRLPSLVKTSIPGRLDYPIQHINKGWEMCTGVVELGYGMSITKQAQGLWKIITNG